MAKEHNMPKIKKIKRNLYVIRTEMVMLMVVKHMIRKISGLNLYLMWRCYFRFM